MKTLGSVIAGLWLSLVASSVCAQVCPVPSSTGPDTPSRIRTLDGRLIYHNDIRHWFELRLDKPQCGEKSVQLVRTDGKYKLLEQFRGCLVRSSGAIGIAETGYYSLNLYQDTGGVEPIKPCHTQSALPDYPTSKPDKRIRAYQVTMRLSYRPGDHPIAFEVRSAGRSLHPWQAYARYDLTGGYVLYGHCADGFVVDKVSGTPATHPMHFDGEDMAAFDPEAAAQAGHRDLVLGYTCIRAPSSAH